MRYMISQFHHRPMIPLTVILFASIIVLSLCSLQDGSIAAQAHFDELYHQIEVRCTVTNLAGTRSDGLEIYPGILFRFTGEQNPNPKDPEQVADLVEDVQIKGSWKFQWNGEEYTLAGITSTRIASPLRPENGSTIFYNEGAEESFFSGDGMQCIIPLDMMKKIQKQALPENALEIRLEPQHKGGGAFEGALQILGTYHSADEKTVYCPWDTYVSIIRSMDEFEIADACFATLRSNDDVELLRKKTEKWLAAPDPSFAGQSQVNGISLALDIDDSQLRQAEQTLENSMAVNRVASILVLILSTGAGAFVGFLMIRSRKKDIALMRTMGTPNSSIYCSFVLEQMIFVILGAVVGGSKFMWTPALWLVLFVCAYFAGLSGALLIMLRKNLLTTTKEDE